MNLSCFSPRKTVHPSPVLLIFFAAALSACAPSKKGKHPEWGQPVVIDSLNTNTASGTSTGTASSTSSQMTTGTSSTTGTNTTGITSNINTDSSTTSNTTTSGTTNTGGTTNSTTSNTTSAVTTDLTTNSTTTTGTTTSPTTTSGTQGTTGANTTGGTGSSSPAAKPEVIDFDKTTLRKLQNFEIWIGPHLGTPKDMSNLLSGSVLAAAITNITTGGKNGDTAALESKLLTLAQIEKMTKGEATSGKRSFVIFVCTLKAKAGAKDANLRQGDHIDFQGVTIDTSAASTTAAQFRGQSEKFTLACWSNRVDGKGNKINLNDINVTAFNQALEKMFYLNPLKKRK